VNGRRSRILRAEAEDLAWTRPELARSVHRMLKRRYVRGEWVSPRRVLRDGRVTT
jgi:hypothetical protein